MLDTTLTEKITDDAGARQCAAPGRGAGLTGANSAVILLPARSLARRSRHRLARDGALDVCTGHGLRHAATGAISRAAGRRVALIIGTGCGVATGFRCVCVLHASFRLFCGATFFGGLYGAVAQSIALPPRTAPASRSVQAVSWVMAGGVFAGVLGRSSAMDHGHLAAISVRLQFVAQAIVALVAMAVCRRRCAKTRRVGHAGGGRLRSRGSRASLPPRCAASSLPHDEPGDDLKPLAMKMSA